MTNTTPNNNKAIEEDIYHFLVGCFRANPDRIAAVLNYPDWQQRAKEELDRRLTRMLETFSDETLQALADGTVDLRDIAARVAAEKAPGG